MASSNVSDLENFINLFKDRKKEDYGGLAEKYLDDIKLIDTIITTIENKHSSTENACDAIFEIIFVLLHKHHSFCMNFVPSIIWSHYLFLATKNKSQNSSMIDAILLSIYNKIVDSNTKADTLTSSFRVPILSKPSIYHEPFSLNGSAAMSLTENSLTQHDKADVPIQIKGPTNYVDRIPAGLRSLIMKTVLLDYNAYLSCVAESSLKSLCNLVVRACLMGYNMEHLQYHFIGKEELDTLSNNYGRIKLHSDVIEQLVTGLHFFMYNGGCEEAKSALSYLHERSRYSLSSSGLLNTRALLDLSSLSTNMKDYSCLPVLDPLQMKYHKKFKMNSTAEFRKHVTIQSAPMQPSRSIANSSPNALSISAIETTLHNGCNMKNGSDKENMMLDALPTITQNPDNQTQILEKHIYASLPASDIDLHQELEDSNTSLSTTTHIEEEEYDKSTDKTPLIEGAEDSSSNNSDTLKDSNRVLLKIKSCKEDKESYSYSLETAM